MDSIDLIEPYRDPAIIKHYINKIIERRNLLNKSLSIMEVCGGHTHSILKYGIEKALSGYVNFLHGPGCPVCIVPKERIDHAIWLAKRKDVILITLGDVIRVPGSSSSLAKARAEGADVRFVYSPADAIEIARQNPTKTVVYFAIGFETTTPMTAWLVKKSYEENIQNLFFHVNHVLVAPAMQALVSDRDHKIEAFLGPSHVSVVAGADIYNIFSEQFSIPVVVGGFEPVDVLEAVLMIFDQFLEKKCAVEIQYKRAATFAPNSKSKILIDSVFEIAPQFRWRGLGNIPNSSLQLQKKYKKFNVFEKFKNELSDIAVEDDPGCLCPEILKGKKTPTDCVYFAKTCNPQNPVGACMVSTEGACSAYYQYGNYEQ
ncbi:MAG: hydrogenase formation protein HypD [Leptospirales bacterium]